MNLMAFVEASMSMLPYLYLKVYIFLSSTNSPQHDHAFYTFLLLSVVNHTALSLFQLQQSSLLDWSDMPVWKKQTPFIYHGYHTCGRHGAQLTVSMLNLELRGPSCGPCWVIVLCFWARKSIFKVPLFTSYL